MIRTNLPILLFLALAACQGGSGGAGNDASIGSVFDADPTAPDADIFATDAGVSGATDAASSSVVDASVPIGGTLDCGEETCNIATQECCLLGGAASCVPQGDCGGGTSATCDGPEDCGGEVCCASFSGAVCSATCEGAQVAELCHVESDCSVAGDMCCELGPVAVCSPSCMGGGGGFP